MVVLGPFPVAGIPATITFTPRGLVADKATVIMDIQQSGISATATHVSTDGGMHCTGTSSSDGTNLVTVASILTIQMRNALCGGSTALADLSLTSVTAPDAVVAGSNVVHTAVAKNNGPAAALNMQIAATHNAVLGDPTTVSCPGATPTTGTVTSGSVVCVWNGNTTSLASRTMTLTWPTTVDDLADVLDVDYTRRRQRAAPAPPSRFRLRWPQKSPTWRSTA